MVNNSPLRVLVIEDEPLLRWSIVESLSTAGHTVVEAADAETALRSLSDAAPLDVVLLDYRLPDTANLSLLATIRSQAPRLPVVMMTAFGTPSLVTDARRMGAYDVLDKPFDVYGLDPILRSAREAAGTLNIH